MLKGRRGKGRHRVPGTRSTGEGTAWWQGVQVARSRSQNGEMSRWPGDSGGVERSGWRWNRGKAEIFEACRRPATDRIQMREDITATLPLSLYHACMFRLSLIAVVPRVQEMSSKIARDMDTGTLLANYWDGALRWQPSLHCKVLVTISNVFYTCLMIDLLLTCPMNVNHSLTFHQI